MATLDDYKRIFKNVYKDKSANDYCRYVDQINKLCKRNNQSVEGLINDAIKNKEDKPVDWLLNTIKINYPSKTSQNTRNDYRSGLKKFAEVVFGVFNANTWMSMVTDNDVLCSIIAQNALFASKDVVDDVIDGKLGTKFNINIAKRLVKDYNNPYASWDYMSYYRGNPLKKATPADPPNFSNNYPGTLPQKKTR